MLFFSMKAIVSGWVFMILQVQLSKWPNPSYVTQPQVDWRHSSIRFFENLLVGYKKSHSLQVLRSFATSTSTSSWSSWSSRSSCSSCSSCPLWIIMNHHESSWIIMNHHESSLNHHESSWIIIMNHHHESSSWIIIMNHHHESSSWIIIMNHHHESSSWIIIIIIVIIITIITTIIVMIMIIITAITIIIIIVVINVTITIAITITTTTPIAGVVGTSRRRLWTPPQLCGNSRTRSATVAAKSTLIWGLVHSELLFCSNTLQNDLVLKHLRCFETPEN